MDPVLLVIFAGGFLIGRNLSRVRKVSAKYTAPIEKILVSSTTSTIDFMTQHKEKIKTPKPVTNIKKTISKILSTKKKKVTKKAKPKLKPKSKAQTKPKRKVKVKTTAKPKTRPRSLTKRAPEIEKTMEEISKPESIQPTEAEVEPLKEIGKEVVDDVK